MTGPDIRLILKARGKRIGALAKQIGCSRIALSRFLNGHGGIRLRLYLRIIRAIGYVIAEDAATSNSEEVWGSDVSVRLKRPSVRGKRDTLRNPQTLQSLPDSR